MNNTHSALLVAVTAVVTIAIRFLSFLIFGDKRKTPPFVQYLGKVLPYAIMGMLVVFCLKGISFTQAPHGIPELAASLLVVALHVWKRSTLISIVGGTAFYMFLVQAVF